MIVGSSAAMPAPAIGIETLIEALERETRLLLELAVVLKRQREGFAAQDAQAVDDSIFAVHRVMRTLEEARRRRRAVLRIVVGDENVPVRELERALGSRVSPALAGARDRLQDVVRLVERDIIRNRQVLRDADPDGAVESGTPPGSAPAPHNQPQTGDEPVC
ncbi:MAG: flagellar export chaperone FlgN [Longimicrobiales bacterium]